MRVKNPEKYKKCREEYLHGVSLDAIAERNGVPRHTLVNWYNRYQWRNDRLELQRRAKEISIERLANRLTENVTRTIEIANVIIQMVIALLQTIPTPLDAAGLERLERIGRIAKTAIGIQNEAEPYADEAVMARLMAELNEIKCRYRVDVEEVVQSNFGGKLV